MRMIFVNLPVKDVRASRRFFGALGFTFNEQFSNENSAAMTIEENIVAMLLERRPGRVERLGGPAELARDQRDLGLGDDAAGAGHRLLRAEGARRALHQGFRAQEIAELRHGDAAQRQRRRVVAQGDPVQGAERITRRQRARRGRDQRVHGNPATLVTPTVSTSGPKCIA